MITFDQGQLPTVFFVPLHRMGISAAVIALVWEHVAQSSLPAHQAFVEATGRAAGAVRVRDQRASARAWKRYTHDYLTPQLVIDALEALWTTGLRDRETVTEAQEKVLRATTACGTWKSPEKTKE